MTDVLGGYLSVWDRKPVLRMVYHDFYDRIVAVQLLTARGRWDDGEAVFEHHEPHWGELTTLWRLERGRVRDHPRYQPRHVADEQRDRDSRENAQSIGAPFCSTAVAAVSMSGVRNSAHTSLASKRPRAVRRAHRRKAHRTAPQPSGLP